MYKYSIVTSKCTFSINCALVWCHSFVLLGIMRTVIKIMKLKVISTLIMY